ncbi:hypothetical protein BEN48_03445 [Hymenobacter glacialis]|uniref:Uncharacterized protein n=1 Tax=Hymenobacter glacialis TaxID=1908236 RepID=A0A1G1SYY4_9BACT|nr:hypothetical protein BEN48_03445 [Hymenobacter glacialis]
MTTMQTKNSWLLALSVVFISLEAHGQKLPVPGTNNPDWVLREIPPRHGMPTLRVYALPQPGRPLQVDQRNAETGAITRLTDPAHGLFYDLENSTIKDQRDGKRYFFYRKGRAPKALRSEIRFL